MFGSTNEAIRSSTFSRNVSTAHTRRLLDMIDDAVSTGGEIATGGSDFGDEKARYFPPTIIYNPSAKSRVMTEEVRRGVKAGRGGRGTEERREV